MDPSKDIILIGVSGKLGSGKDYVIKNFLSRMVCPYLPYITLSFADAFKVRGIVESGLDRDKVYGKKDDVSRTELQRLGTEEGRKKFGDDVWINYVHQQILNHYERGIKVFFICDCRFKNELAYIEKMNGKVVRIDAPYRNLQKLCEETSGDEKKMEKIASHMSETELDNYNFELVLPNDPANEPINAKMYTSSIFGDEETKVDPFISNKAFLWDNLYTIITKIQSHFFGNKRILFVTSQILKNAQHLQNHDTIVVLTNDIIRTSQNIPTTYKDILFESENKCFICLSSKYQGYKDYTYDL
jgi:hypothetical protein